MAHLKPKSAVRTVDPYSGCGIGASIYEDENGVVWNSMLNFTDISYGSYGCVHCHTYTTSNSTSTQLTKHSHVFCLLSNCSNNKFYSIQLIQGWGQYRVFRKWGRVGAAKPASATEVFGTSLDCAKRAFQKNFMSKSGNNWPLEGPFEKKKGKYVFVELADDEPEDDNNTSDSKSATDANAVKSELPDKVQDVLKLICDSTLIAKEVSSMNIDLKRMPLGRLSKTQISQGYGLLQQLSDALTAIDEIENPPAPVAPVRATKVTRGRRASAPVPVAPAPATTGRSSRRRATAPNATATAAAAATPAPASAAPATPAKKKKLSAADVTRLRNLKTELKTLSSEFYSLIPHDFGRSLPPVLDTMEVVKTKIDLLQVLADIELSQQLQQEEKKNSAASGTQIHPLDAQYKMINTRMEPLDPTCDEFKQIERYVESTQAPSQTQYKLKIQSIMRIARPPEEQPRSIFEKVDNHRLLWHGSRLSNVVGILSQGLRIAPPEAPKNGYMFGKGIYFADSVSKSANYCWTSPDRPRAVLLLAEVALGKSYEAPQPEYLDFKAIHSHGCASTKGVGCMAPKEETFERTSDGVVVPIGQIAPQTNIRGAGVMFNEFIVYQTEQVKLRYLITTDFDYSARSGGFGY